jgi:heat shock protein HslJ
VRIATVLCLLAVCGFLVHAQDRNYATDERALVGKEWRLVSLGPAGAESNVVPGAAVTLRFADTGRASGSTGCNNFSGTYTVRGDTISFGAMASTRRACTDQRANEQEQRFLAAFDSARRFRLVSTRLTIYYTNGRNVLNFVDANATPPNEPQPTKDDPVAALTAYYAAINERNFQEAYRYWESPASSLNTFARGFAGTERSRLFVEPPAPVEGAAGSLYAEIPTIVVAETRNGERLFAGCYVMRRRNDSEGTWRIYRANLLPVAANAPLTRRLSTSCQR